MNVGTPRDLDAAAIVAVADGEPVRLAPGLLTSLTHAREATVRALAEAGPVYGVSTGMGLQSHLAVGTADRPAYQNDLMLARSVGGPPWLERRTVRAVIATRLRTLLEPEVGVTPALAEALVALLDADVVPAIPATGNGAAGEIIPLAHLGAFLTGHGVDVAGRGVRDAGPAPYTFAAKEGVAFLQGVPVATARAVLLATETRLLTEQSLVAAAASVTVVRAPRDPHDARLARGDDDLAQVLAVLRDLTGEEDAPRMLQAPVSFRVVGHTAAALVRASRHLQGAADRALVAVSTSPALVDGRFLGTAGFDGFDLASALDGTRLAVLHAAEVGVARLHRLLDPRVTGLPAQLSAEPGRQAGLVAVHKRASARVHAARRTSAPASLGAAETSLGQEDVQSYGLEAAEALHDALDVLRDVVACELLAHHQARLLDSGLPTGSDRLETVLRQGFEGLQRNANDRPFGLEIAAIGHGLGLGWAHGLLTREGRGP